ncbi:mandelate racemase/muconate lactonizing enzyme family protein [Stygiolobus caldivivus]|uniref:Mandelate racemase/muconate lactonizing enzyme C-terminal domain-containing protein n=1 Tax=Stygiolobus caldivivus TaxID=2824673 RepID=A0A8D5U6A2_9CREN|nr:mandelate racemase/muconate lactonizing enzyme family protein [Stygiolobus caldivivus]BCU70032.1 hypothetical protein KN1_13290 [Stygiolobus caldivivus]
MKVSVFHLSIPFLTDPPSDWTEQWAVQLYVKVEEWGERGWGETLVAGSGIIGAYSSVITELIKPFLEGDTVSSPYELESLLEKIMFSAGNCGVVTGAISSVEMAIWGLRAKKMGVPLADLFGGRSRGSVKVYGSFPRFSRIEDVLRVTEAVRERGLNFIKLHQPPSTVLETIKAIREKYREMKVAVDLNSPFDLNGAKEFVNKVSRYEIEWVEEPLYPPNDYYALEKLTRASPVPIAAGENEYTLHGFRALLESGVSYLQPDIAKIGGVSKFLKVLELASSYHVKVAPHDRPDRSPVSLIYTLNLASARGEIEVVEYPITDFPTDLFPSVPVFKGGYVVPPENVEVREEAIAKYPYTSKVRILHFSDLEGKLIKSWYDNNP